VVAHTDRVATTTKVESQHRPRGLDNVQSPPPRRRAKRGQLSRGRNRAGITTKLHLAITAENHVVEGLLTGGNVADITVANDLTADVVGCHVAEDMGYDSDDHRRVLESNNNVPVIPGRKNRKIEIVYDKAIYAWRRYIEIFFGKLNADSTLKCIKVNHLAAAI